MTYLSSAASRAQLAAFYHDTLLDDVIPFWLRHGVENRSNGSYPAPPSESV